jgi:hypothetical protein
MGNFLLLLILFVLASVLLLIVYLIDRVNLIEKQTVDRAATELKNNNASGPFRGMEGEDLWNAMSYNRMPPLEDSIIEEIKPRYEFILLKHVEKTFELGKDHALKNIETKPVNQITLPTLRGPVESWIPQNFCEEIYNAGFESINANQTNIEEIKYRLDSAVVQLFDKVKINLTEPISNQLLKNQIQNLENLENNIVPESDSVQNETKIEDVQNNEPVEIEATNSAENPSDVPSNKVEEKVTEAPETVKQG